MPLLDLLSLKNEAKTLKKKLGQRGIEITLSQARDFIAQSAGSHDWNTLYLKESSSKNTDNKRDQTPFYRDVFSSATKRTYRLFATLLEAYPYLDNAEGRKILSGLTQCVLSPALGIDDILIKQETPETCEITPSMMTSSRWKGGLGIIGQGRSAYTQVMFNWTLPWLREHGGMVFIRQNDLPKLLDELQSKTALPVRIIDLTTPPFPLDGEELTQSTLNVPGMARLATKTDYPDELKPFLLAGQMSNSMWDGRRRVFLSALLSALNEYKRLIGDVGAITNYFQLEALYNLAYDIRLPRPSTSGLRIFLESLQCVEIVDGNTVFAPKAGSENQMTYITSVVKWAANVTNVNCDNASLATVCIEDLLHDRAITIFVAQDRSPMKRFGTDGSEYFTVMKNAILGLFSLSELKKRKDTPLLIGAHDIELLCDLSPIHDLLIDIRHAGWGWVTQIPTEESLSGVNFENEQLLKFVENTLQLPGPTLPIFREFDENESPRWRDQRKAQTLSLGSDKTPNPWIVTAKDYNSTSKD